jgi:PAS domain S-box-containing protein
MIKWLLNNKTKKAQKEERARAVITALESQQNLENAAKGTMTLAKDVTITLQARIDDYAAQIDQTSRLLSDALFLVDSSGTIESFNPAAEDIFGWSKRDIIGQSIKRLFKFEDENVVIDITFLDELLGRVNDDSVSTFTVHYESFMGVCFDGMEIHIDVGASKLTRSDGKVFYLILVRDVTHRVNNAKTMAMLAQRNQELVTALNSSNTGFAILEPDGPDFKISFVNSGLEKMTGITRKLLLDMHLRNIVDLDKGYWSVCRTLNDQVEARHEIQISTRYHTYQWCDVQITPVKDGDKVVQWILVFYDTTELKKAYDEVRKSEAHFRAFGEASSEAMLVHSNNSILDWNDRLVLLTGYDESEIERITPLDFVHPLEREKVRKRLDDNDIESYETLLMTKRGEVLEVAVNSRPIDWDNAAARIAVMRDVTAFKDIDTQLRSSRERYKTVIDNTIDMICCFDANFRITFTNQTFRDYFDVEIEELTGFSLLEVIPESDHEKFTSYMMSITPDTEIRRGVHRVVRDDEIRWQDWIDRGIFDNDGNLIEIQSVARDITHLIPSQD